jgi:hypothetical protein
MLVVAVVVFKICIMGLIGQVELVELVAEVQVV